MNHNSDYERFKKKRKYLLLDIKAMTALTALLIILYVSNKLLNLSLPIIIIQFIVGLICLLVYISILITSNMLIQRNDVVYYDQIMYYKNNIIGANISNPHTKTNMKLYIVIGNTEETITKEIEPEDEAILIKQIKAYEKKETKTIEFIDNIINHGHCTWESSSVKNNMTQNKPQYQNPKDK